MRPFFALLVLALCPLVRGEAPPLQQWIDEAIQAGGGIVTVPEGTHVLDQGLILNKAKKLALRGVNKERCILKLRPPAALAQPSHLIAITGTCETLEIANLTLDGSFENKGQVTDLIRVNGMTAPANASLKDITIRDCLLQNFLGSGVLIHNTEGGVVERCSFRDGGAQAVGFWNFSKGCIARGNRITRVSKAFDLLNSSACLIEGNEVGECETGVSILNEYPATDKERHILRNNGFSNSFLFVQPGSTPQPLTEANDGLIPFPKN
ncbi:MAG: right-handed parallel beta-helix repeat-containing protein [Verrucomicrobiota bacterium]